MLADTEEKPTPRLASKPEPAESDAGKEVSIWPAVLLLLYSLVIVLSVLTCAIVCFLRLLD